MKCRDLVCGVEPPPLKNCLDLTMKLEVKYLFSTSSSGANQQLVIDGATQAINTFATQVFKPIKIYYILPKKTEKNPNPINISHTLPKKPPDSFSEKNNPTKISYIYPKKKQDFLYFPKKTNLPISFERADNQAHQMFYTFFRKLIFAFI